MTISTTAHLNFRGDAREALEFYASVFDGKATIITYGDFGLPPELPDAAKVVWGQVEAPNGFRVMAYDVPGRAEAAPVLPGTRREQGQTLTGQPFFMSVRGDSADEAGALWERLADGGAVVEGFGPTPWAPAFGMLTDRFGVTWIVDVAVP